MGRFLFVVNFFFGDSQHFLLSDNTGPKRLLQSPAPLALFPPLPRKTFATYINPTPNNILTRNIYPQLFATALLWTPPVLGPVFDNTVSRLFPHNKCESPTERKELSRKRLQRPFLHTVVSRGSHLAFAPSFSSIMVHVDIKKIRKTIFFNQLRGMFKSESQQKILVILTSPAAGTWCRSMQLLTQNLFLAVPGTVSLDGNFRATVSRRGRRVWHYYNLWRPKSKYDDSYSLNPVQFVLPKNPRFFLARSPVDFSHHQLR